MKVVLMDRDGTLIVDPPDLRVDSVKEIQLFPDTIEALTYLATHNFGIIMISNQAGIAEGLLVKIRSGKSKIRVLHSSPPAASRF